MTCRLPRSSVNEIERWRFSVSHVRVARRLSQTREAVDAIARVFRYYSSGSKFSLGNPGLSG